MAKIRCEHCGQRQSEKNDDCQFCGAPLPDDKMEQLRHLPIMVCSTSGTYGNEVYYEYSHEYEKMSMEYSLPDEELPDEEEPTIMERMKKPFRRNNV
jgi:hypothetical protein